jgi:hypothetical protein
LRYWLLVPALALAACSTSADRLAKLNAMLDAQCAAIGVGPADTRYQQCRQEAYRQYEIDEQQRAIMAAAVLQGMQGYTNAYQPQPQAAPRNCVTNYVANSAYTNCY